MESSSLSEMILDHRNDLSDAKSVDSYVFYHWLQSLSLIKTLFPFRAFSIDSGIVTTQEVCEHDLSSMRTEKLYNELQRAKEDLKSKDSEIHRPNELRQTTDREIEDLTASLFEVRRFIPLNESRPIYSFLVSTFHGWSSEICSSKCRREIESIKSNSNATKRFPFHKHEYYSL